MNRAMQSIRKTIRRAQTVALPNRPGRRTAKRPLSVERMESRLLLSGMSLVGQWDGHNHTYADVWGHGNFGYVTHFGNPGGVDIIDLTDPTNPTLASVFLGAAFNELKDVEVARIGSQDIGFFSHDGGGGVYVVDVTNPYNPVELTRITSTIGGLNSVHTLTVSGNYLYEVDSQTPNIKVFDVSNPSTPVLVRTIVSPSNGPVHEATALGGRLYTAVINTTGFADVFDISDVANSAPLITSFVTGPRAHTSWPTEDGNFLVVARETTGGDVRIFDISNPASVTLVATISVPTTQAHSSHQVMVMGDRLYVSWYQAGVRVYDISNPASPVFVADYDTFPGAVSGFNGCWGVYPYLGTDRILASDMQTGLYVLSIPEPLSYTAPSGNGADSLTLRQNLDGEQLEIFDNNAGVVVARRLRSATTTVQISGADNETDTLTVDFAYGGHFTVPGGISFSGGVAGADSIRVKGTGTTTGTYQPSSTTAGDGSLTVASGVDTVSIAFTGLEPVQVSGMADFTLTTPNSNDVLLVGAATGSGSEPANIITGSSGGVAIEPLVFFDVTSFTIDASSNDAGSPDDAVTVAATGLAAQGLQTFAFNSGAGSDVLNTSSASFALPVPGGSFGFDAGAGTDRVVASADVNFTLTNTSLASSGGGSIVLIGLAGEEAVLTGGAAANTINMSGFSGSTTVAGGLGNDTIIGGSGPDLWLVQGTTVGETIKIDPDTTGVIKATRGTEIDRFTYGTGDRGQVQGLAGNDTLQVGSSVTVPFTLDGGPGNDKLTGGKGADVLLGQDGNDTLNGRLGDDTFDGGTGTDTWIVDGTSSSEFIDVDWNGGTGQLLANRRLTDAGPPVETDAASSVEKLTVRGQNGSDEVDLALLDAADLLAAGLTNTTVEGGSGSDTLLGSAGTDSFKGGSGDDLIDGGLGMDTWGFDGTSGSEFIDYDLDIATGQLVANRRLTEGGMPVQTVRASAIEKLVASGLNGADKINLSALSASDIAAAGLTGITVDGGQGADTLIGSDGNDVIRGGSGVYNDSLVGGLGNDTLDGAQGTDTLDGGDGVDSCLNGEVIFNCP